MGLNLPPKLLAHRSFVLSSMIDAVDFLCCINEGCHGTARNVFARPVDQSFC